MPRPTDRAAAVAATSTAASAVLARTDRTPDDDPVVRLVEGWLADDSGYDEATWPDLKAALDRERAADAARPLFDPSG